VRAAITGASGFIGQVLAQECTGAGCCVLGLDIREPKDDFAGAAFELCDVRDAESLSDFIMRFQPDKIFHLAAQSYPTVSLRHPRETIDTNVLGTVNVFECLRTSGKPAVVVVACSSAEYGPVMAADLPIREDHALNPLHPYGVSKVAQDLLAAQYFVNYSIPTVRIRIFNTTGPGKLGDVCSDLTRRAVEIELGIRERSLPVGNLTSRRSLVDVRDMARALRMAADCCEAGDVYNVGGKAVYSVQEVIDVMSPHVRADFSLERKEALSRHCDEPVIAGDNSKFQDRCAWEPEIDLTRTLRDMLDWWRIRFESNRVPPEGAADARVAPA